MLLAFSGHCQHELKDNVSTCRWGRNKTEKGIKQGQIIKKRGNETGKDNNSR